MKMAVADIAEANARFCRGRYPHRLARWIARKRLLDHNLDMHLRAPGSPQEGIRLLQRNQYRASGWNSME